MIIKAKDNKRRLTPGVHLVTIKDICIARHRPDKGIPGMPIEVVDSATGEAYGAIEVLMMDKDKVGIWERFYLGEKQQWIMDRFVQAIGFAPGEPIPEGEAIGRKLWIAVAQCMQYENEIIRTDHVGAPIWYPKLLPQFWPGDQQKPVVKGNPQDNMGICGPEFRLHQDNKIGFFTPTPNYVSPTDLPQGFGQIE